MARSPLPDPVGETLPLHPFHRALVTAGLARRNFDAAVGAGFGLRLGCVDHLSVPIAWAFTSIKSRSAIGLNLPDPFGRASTTSGPAVSFSGLANARPSRGSVAHRAARSRTAGPGRRSRGWSVWLPPPAGTPASGLACACSTTAPLWARPKSTTRQIEARTWKCCEIARAIQEHSAIVLRIFIGVRTHDD